MKRIIFVIVIVFIAVLAWRGFPYKKPLLLRTPDPNTLSLVASPTPSPIQTPKPSPTPLPAKITLEVPFLVQAPYANWDAAHEEMCEEASLLNVAYFLQKRTPANKDAGESELQALVKWETDHGYKVDVTLQELNQIAKDFYGFKTGRVETVMSVDKIKRELVAGRPLIVGAAGKILPNPHFKNGGPKYHMLVIKGYDNNRSIDPKECRVTAAAVCNTKPGVFITNDVGIWQGNNFLYTYDNLMASIHNWDETNILNGQKAYLVFD